MALAVTLQVRMMAAILFLVGSGQEEPTVRHDTDRATSNVVGLASCTHAAMVGVAAGQVVDELLDVAKFEGRPHYQMASEIPLVFWEAAYDEIEWTYDPGTLPPTAAPACVLCAVCGLAAKC